MSSEHFGEVLNNDEMMLSLRDRMSAVSKEMADVSLEYVKRSKELLMMEPDEEAHEAAADNEYLVGSLIEMQAQAQYVSMMTQLDSSWLTTQLHRKVREMMEEMKGEDTIH